MTTFSLPWILSAVALGLGAQETPSPLRSKLDAAKAAVAEKAGGLDVSAFSDWGTWYDEVGKKRFGWGAAEVDLELRLGDLFEVSGAYVATQDEKLWGVYFLDWHPFGGGKVAPRGGLSVEKGFHIQVGRFDVPFGGDWQYLASKDSVSVSRPLATDLILEGGYNDRGLRLLGNTGTVNFNLYALQGFNEGRLYGGRVAFTPFARPFALNTEDDTFSLELGFSGFVDQAPGGHQAERAFAVDLEAHAGAFALLAEYMGRQRRPLEGGALWQRGWHVTPQWHFGGEASTAFARYDKVWGGIPEGEDPLGEAQPTIRFSVGLSHTLWETVQAKVEFQRSLRSTPALAEDPQFTGDRVIFQVVVVL